MPDTNVFSKLRSFTDYTRENDLYKRSEEEFNMRKQDALFKKQILHDKLKSQRNDPKNLASDAVFRHFKGQELSPDDMAALQTVAAMDGSKTQYKPDEFGNVRAVTQDSPYAAILNRIQGNTAGEAARPVQQGQFGGMDFPPVDMEAPLTPQQWQDQNPVEASRNAVMQRQAQIGSNPYQREDLQMKPDDSFYGMMNVQKPQIDPRAASSPKVQMSIAEAEGKGNIDLANKMKMAQFDNQIQFANTELKTDQGQQKVQNILDRMGQLNDELQKRGGLVSDSQSFLQRADSAMMTTGLGQGVRKISDPQTQALAEEYRSLQATLLPYYATAAGLGAKSLDSEGERKSILDSFGSPTGIYQANKNQLDNLYVLFGGTPKQEQGAAGGDFGDLLEYMTPEERALFE